MKTNSNNYNKPDQLNDAEQEVIMNVIKKAEMLDKVEQERVGYGIKEIVLSSSAEGWVGLGWVA